MPPLRTGLLSFGLVSIPVQLHTATQDQHIAFNLLHAKCGSRGQNRYHCPVCNVVVERDDQVRGYEFEKGQYVQFTEAELGSLETESSNNIELKEFIPLSEIDPVYSRIHTISAPVKAERSLTDSWLTRWQRTNGQRSPSWLVVEKSNSC